MQDMEVQRCGTVVALLFLTYSHDECKWSESRPGLFTAVKRTAAFQKVDKINGMKALGPRE
jgi:hypothetical protein